MNSTIPGQIGRDLVVEAVRSKLRDRSERGLSKYGVTVADAALSREQWLTHAQEEAMDLAIYLERLLSEQGTKSADASGIPESVSLSSPKDTGESKESGGQS